MDLAALRQNYTLSSLSESDVNPDPVAQFRIWFEQALNAGLLEPNAMTLATTTPQGTPSARIVLLKEVDDAGFIFYTNYESDKAVELAGNPRAALVFFWAELQRQVRIQGTASRVSAGKSEAYFHTRPVGSKLGAWASRQSAVIASRQMLERNLEARTTEFAGTNIPAPPFWGGFRLIPNSVEFWQGRRNRLHDRIRYRYSGDTWIIERLSP